MADKPNDVALREWADQQHAALVELVECARLRGDNELPHPCDDPKLWTARMIDAWDVAAECANTEAPEPATQPAQPGALDARTVRARALEEAARIADDMQSDDPAPGDTNAACREIADAIRALAHQLEGAAGAAATATQGDAEPVAVRWRWKSAGGGPALPWEYCQEAPKSRADEREVEPLYAAPRPACDDARDAARYRWCREQEGFDLIRIWHEADTLEAIDAAIDAAIAKQDGGAE